MAINKESNVYTIVFATIMVIVVGGILAFLATSLKEAKLNNVQNEKKQNIIQATGFYEDKSKVNRNEAGDLFNEFVKRRLTIDFEGNVVFDSKGELAEGKEEIDMKNPLDAFSVEPRKQYRTDDKDKLFPIFVCEKDGKTVYVVSCSGKGLWDDVWGYVGIGQDGNTIMAAKFDHKGETAGLGSIINEPKFQNQFNEDQNKTLEGPNGNYAGINVVKPGSQDLNANTVDGLSGATFTGAGVRDMLNVYLEVYYNYFKNASAL